jgi:hypothetical protein
MRQIIVEAEVAFDGVMGGQDMSFLGAGIQLSQRRCLKLS